MTATQESLEQDEISDVMHTELHDAIIVGAGAAGVGVAIALSHAGVENFLLIDRKEVGSSFESWPDETRFITPSFPSNSIGMLDLNSIAVGVSPAFSMRVEHPTGSEFAKHLQDLASFFELPLQENTDVKSIEKKDGVFHLVTDAGTFLSSNVIWAAGEYQYPQMRGFTGSELCRHTSTVPNYGQLEGEDFLIRARYASGFAAAYHLAKRGCKVHLFDKESPWNESSSDPSISLSTFSFERMRDPTFEENVKLFPQTPIRSVTLKDGIYEVTTADFKTFQSKQQPLLASGFDGSHRFVSDFFEQREDGFPLLSDRDESTIVPGMFLAGPSVRHGSLIFCFIFKYRQRFGIVAEAIASSIGIPTEEFIDAYKSWGMYLDDLSCCGQECLTC